MQKVIHAKYGNDPLQNLTPYARARRMGPRTMTFKGTDLVCSTVSQAQKTLIIAGTNFSEFSRKTANYMRANNCAPKRNFA